MKYFVIYFFSDEYKGYYDGNSYSTQAGIRYPGIVAFNSIYSVKSYTSEKSAIKEAKSLATIFATLGTFGFKIYEMPDTKLRYQATYEDRKLITEQKN